MFDKFFKDYPLSAQATIFWSLPNFKQSFWVEKNIFSNFFFSNFEKIGLSFNIYKKKQDWYGQTKIIREIAQSV